MSRREGTGMLRLIEILLCFWAQGARRLGRLVTAIFLIATLAAGWYAVENLKVNTDTTDMLDANLPFQQRAQQLKDAFPQIKNELSIIVRAPTIDEADAFAQALHDRLNQRGDIVSGTYSAAQDPFFQNNGLLFLSESKLESQLSNLTRASGLIEDLINNPGIDNLFSTLAENDSLAARSDLGQDTLTTIYEDLAEVVETALDGGSAPFSWRGVLTEETPPPGGYMRIVNTTPVADYSRIQPIKPALEGIRAEIDALTPKFDGRVTALVTGSLALRGEELESVTEGISQSFAVSLVLVSILLLLAYRSLYVSVLTVVALIITLVLTSAYAAFAYTELNLVSIAFTVLLVGLGLDFSIHFLLHVQEYRASGKSLKVAMNKTMREVGGGMALAAPTTALAFFSFLPTRFDGIAQLGAVAGVGVLVAFFVSITFLPAAMGVAPSAVPKRKIGTVRRGFSLIHRIAIPIAVVASLLGVAALTLLPKARFDADPMALRSVKAESVIAFNMLFDDEDTVPYRLTRLVDSETAVRETVTKAEKIETVRDTRSLLDFVPQNQDDKLELIDFAAGSLAFVLTKQPAERTTPPTGSGVDDLVAQLEDSLTRPDLASEDRAARERLAEALQNVQRRRRGGDIVRPDTALLPALDDLVFAYWPDLVRLLQAQFNADYVDIDTLPEAIVKRYRTDDGVWRVDLLPAEDVREPQFLTRYVDSAAAIFPDIAGGAIQWEKAGRIIAESMLQASLLALVVIGAVLFIVVRRASTVFLMLFPLALAAVLTIATGVVFDVPFNYANVIVLPLLMGIGIDSGIHLVLRQQKVERRSARGQAVASVYGTATPRAVLFSAMTTVGSFGSLMLSEHRGTASMGQLLSIAIAYTLVCTLIVLPAVFRVRDQRRNGN